MLPILPGDPQRGDRTSAPSPLIGATLVNDDCEAVGVRRSSFAAVTEDTTEQTAPWPFCAEQLVVVRVTTPRSHVQHRLAAIPGCLMVLTDRRVATAVLVGELEFIATEAVEAADPSGISIDMEPAGWVDAHPAALAFIENMVAQTTNMVAQTTANFTDKVIPS